MKSRGRLAAWCSVGTLQLLRNSAWKLMSMGCLLCVSGCDRKTQSDPEPPEALWSVPTPSQAQGPRVEDRDFVLHVEKPRVCESQGALRPPPGSMRVSVGVQVEGRTKRAVPVGPLGFSLEGEDGRRYRPTLAGCEPTFAPREISAGESFSGHVAFDVPSQEKKFELVFEPFLIGRKPVSARAEVPPVAPP